MTLQLHETIRTSDNLLRRYKKIIDCTEYQNQLLLYYNQPYTVKYISTDISCPFTVVVDSFYFPVQSKRQGKTVAYLRSGKVIINEAETMIIWWADLLGAFSGKIHFKD